MVLVGPFWLCTTPSGKHVDECGIALQGGNLPFRRLRLVRLFPRGEFGGDARMECRWHWFEIFFLPLYDSAFRLASISFWVPV